MDNLIDHDYQQPPNGWISEGCQYPVERDFHMGACNQGIEWHQDWPYYFWSIEEDGWVKKVPMLQFDIRVTAHDDTKNFDYTANDAHGIQFYLQENIEDYIVIEYASEDGTPHRITFTIADMKVVK